MSDSSTGSLTADYTIGRFIAALEIFSLRLNDGAQETCALAAEHDAIYIDVSIERLPPDSEDGKKVIALGWHPDEGSGSWCYYT